MCGYRLTFYPWFVGCAWGEIWQEVKGQCLRMREGVREGGRLTHSNRDPAVTHTHTLQSSSQLVDATISTAHYAESGQVWKHGRYLGPHMYLQQWLGLQCFRIWCPVVWSCPSYSGCTRTKLWLGHLTDFLCLSCVPNANTEIVSRIRPLPLHPHAANRR
jgi:hypothetical protein